MPPLMCVLLLCGLVVGLGAGEAAPVFSAAEQACFANKKVFYAADGKCYDLVKKGPCGPGQWLVFDLQEAVNGSGALRPVCKPCPCCDSPLKLYWPQTGGCRKMTEKNLCPQPGTEPVSDPFGEGECACVADPPHLRYDRDANNTSIERCYQLYTRGPCKRKEILVAALLPGYGHVARCASDPCSRENAGTPPGRADHAPYSLHGSTVCHALHTRGPCAGDQLFRVHEDLLQPACVSHATSLFDLAERMCKQELMTDKGCPQQLNAVSHEQHMAYMWQMSSKVVKKKNLKKRT